MVATARVYGKHNRKDNAITITIISKSKQTTGRRRLEVVVVVGAMVKSKGAIMGFWFSGGGLRVA